MGNFKQHVTCSTVTGIVLGGTGYYFGMPLPTCLLSAGLCGMAGMLPDIDSDTSKSFQECIYLAAGIAAVLTVQRLRQFGFENDIIMLSGAFMFLFVRFGVGAFIKKITSHRGMFHSIPAAVLSGEIIFFLSTGTIEERIFKAVGLSIGYFSHLILDEICSIDSSGRLKKSAGTAMKFYDPKRISETLALYTLVVTLGLTAVSSPEFANSTLQQYASEKMSPELRENLETINNIKNQLKNSLQESRTKTQQEAADYLAQNTSTKTNILPNTPTDTLTNTSVNTVVNTAVDTETQPMAPLKMAAPKLTPLKVADNDRNYLFARTRRRASQIPVTETETESAPIRAVSLPLSSSPSPPPPHSLSDLQQQFPPPQPLPYPPATAQAVPQQQQYDSAATQSSAISVSTGSISDTLFERRNSYRNFALPHHEPAPVVLP